MSEYDVDGICTASKAALEMAEKYVTVDSSGEMAELMIGQYVFKMGALPQMNAVADLIQKIVATALDAHTADLRAEVEALRAERGELKVWLKDKRFATENAWRAYRITQDYCNGAMSAFGEVIERLSE